MVQLANLPLTFLLAVKNEELIGGLMCMMDDKDQHVLNLCTLAVRARERDVGVGRFDSS